MKKQLTENIVTGILKKDGKVLMVQRAKREGNLTWVFPGGKVEDGETLEEACIREIKEETGIDVSIACIIGKRKHPDTDKTIYYFGCNYISGEEKVINTNEIISVEFKSKEKFEQDVKTDVYTDVLDFLGWNKI